MELISVRELFKNTEKYADQTVTIGGWVRNRRPSKQFGFIMLNDGTYFSPVQVVYDDTISNFQEISKINIGAALIIKGTVVLTPDSKQPFEIQAKEVTVEGASTGDYPLQPKRHSMEFLRTITHLRPRTNTFQAVFRVRSLAAMAIHQFFQDRDFIYVHTPLITGSDCEGAGEMFQVTTLDLNNIPKTEDGKVDFSQDFYGKPTNLTVSGQLNGETFAMAFKNIYTFGPTFRAEKSNTTRHASEFWMIEPEMAFADLDDLLRVEEDMLKYIISYVLEHAPEEMEFFNAFVDKGLLERLNNILNNDFGRITYTDAVALLEKHNDAFDYPVSWGCDLQTEHERYLTEVIFKKPVFVTDYPKEIKAFYMKLNPDGKTVAAVDCLVPGIGEITGGSQREDNYDLLKTRIEQLGMNPEDYGFYMDLRKYGSCRHAGFGLGFERCVMYLTGMSNIRDVLPFPRTVGNCDL
ncbi:MAG: asparagine--tRNA ligase [Ruminococcaceae bacterium]|nr:asparagine--tRNA ligase [Oscillospiraceae bacterium]